MWLQSRKATTCVQMGWKSCLTVKRKNIPFLGRLCVEMAKTHAKTMNSCGWCSHRPWTVCFGCWPGLCCGLGRNIEKLPRNVTSKNRSFQSKSKAPVDCTSFKILVARRTDSFLAFFLLETIALNFLVTPHCKRGPILPVQSFRRLLKFTIFLHSIELCTLPVSNKLSTKASLEDWVHLVNQHLKETLRHIEYVTAKMLGNKS